MKNKVKISFILIGVILFICFVVPFVVPFAVSFIKNSTSNIENDIPTVTFDSCLAEYDKIGVVNEETKEKRKCQTEHGIGCFVKEYDKEGRIGVLGEKSCKEKPKGYPCLTLDLQEGKLVSWDRYKETKQVCEIKK